MSDVLLQRRCSIIVGDTRINSLPEGLRVAFSVEKTDGREANKATITIANLLPTTRARMDKPGLSVVLEAGYTDIYGVIFAGTAYRTTHKQQGSDHLTIIEAADGGKELSSSFGSWSYRPGITVEAVVADVVRGLGLPLSTGSRIKPSPRTFDRGWSFAGSAAAALDAVTKATGLIWSIQDGQVQVLDQVAGDGTTAVLLSATTGMVGSPERIEAKDGDSTTQGLVSVSALIQPQLRPGRIVDVRSAVAPSLSGRYVVKKQKINGDSHGAEWTTALEMKRA